MREVVTHNAHAQRRVPAPVVRRIVDGVLRREQCSKAAIAVVLTGDRESRRVNRRFRGHDWPTDVLSFTLGDEKHLEGEIYVNVDKAGRQAKTFHVTWENEITRLIVHGTLHLLGYDDGTLSDARRMKRREDKYVDLLAGKEVRPR